MTGFQKVIDKHKDAIVRLGSLVGTGDKKAEQNLVHALESLCYDTITHCYSCGKARSADCKACDRLWQS